ENQRTGWIDDLAGGFLPPKKLAEFTHVRLGELIAQCRLPALFKLQPMILTHLSLLRNLRNTVSNLKACRTAKSLIQCTTKPGKVTLMLTSAHLRFLRP